MFQYYMTKKPRVLGLTITELTQVYLIPRIQALFGSRKPEIMFNLIRLLKTIWKESKGAGL